MYDKSRITAIMLCLILMFQVQAYAGTRRPAEETATYKLTSQNIVNFDGTSGDTTLQNEDTILYKPANVDRGKYVKLTLPKGLYKIECYGSKSASGIKGGYTSGTYEAKNVEPLYLYCGGSNGYNGGGDSAGGATHIAKKAGLLKERSKDYKTSLIMVAGGAGAGSDSSGTGVGGGLSGGNGGGSAYGGGVPNVSVTGSRDEAQGGTQKAGGSGGVSNAGGSCASGKSGSFGQGGTGTYGGGGGFYGGGSGAGTVTYAQWVNMGGGDYTCIGSSATTYGAGGSGYMNSNFLASTTTEQGNNAEAGKIKITCLEIKADYYINILHAPKQVMSGSTFTVRSESEFNSKCRNITEVRYQIKSGSEVLLEKEAELNEATADGDVVTEKYSKQLKMPQSQVNEVVLELIITYGDGEKATMSQIVSIASVKEQYRDEIRYVGQDFELDGNSKWMTNKNLYDELSNSVNKTEPEEVRNLK